MRWRPLFEVCTVYWINTMNVVSNITQIPLTLFVIQFRLVSKHVFLYKATKLHSARECPVNSYRRTTF